MLVTGERSGVLQMRVCSALISTLLFLLSCTEASPAGTDIQRENSDWDTHIKRLCLRLVIDTVLSRTVIPSHRWWEALRGLSARSPQGMAKAVEDEEDIYEILGSVGACRPATHMPCVQVTVVVPLAPAHEQALCAESSCFPECRTLLFHLQLTNASFWPLMSRTMRS